MAAVVPSSNCPVCGAKHDHATSLAYEAAPSPGDAALCIQCGNVAVFADDLTLRQPTPAEQEKLDRDPAVATARAAWKLMQKRH
jgi:hypothetical protein